MGNTLAAVRDMNSWRILHAVAVAIALAAPNPAHATAGVDRSSARIVAAVEAPARSSPAALAAEPIGPFVASGLGVLLFLLRRGPRR